MQKTCKRLFRYIYFVTAFLFLFTVNVNAYIDPSVMTYAIQALAGIAIALGTFFGLYWRKIRKPVLRFFNLDETIGKESESDELVYFDPSCMKEERKIILKEDPAEIMNSQSSSKTKELMKDLLPALFITLAGCFMICIYAPMDLYFTNKTEFWFNVKILISEQLRMFCVVVPGAMVFYLICRLINKKFYSFILFLTTAVLICSYIQGNFRIANLPPMDGTAADWSAYTGENIITLVIWIAVIALLAFIYRYVKAKGFRSVAEVVSVLLTVVLSVSLISSYLGSRNILVNAEFECSKEHEFDVSDTENFYILVLDAVDARTYRELSQIHPEYSEWFEDFTFFPNTTSLYPFTSRAIPHILSGYVYENERDFAEYATDALDNSPIIKAMEERGYQMNIYEPELTYNGQHLDRFANMHVDNTQLNKQYEFFFIKQQIKLSLFKYLPYYLKKYIPVDTNNLIYTKGGNPFTMFNTDFYQDILNENVTHINKKNFAFYHVQGAHVPFVYDANVNIISEDKGSYEQNVEASIKIADAFLNKLKEAGVYDNSSIIIMADHGFQHGDNGIMDRFNPLFMVKGFQEKHTYKISEAPLSYYDLPEAYNRLLMHKMSEECFVAKEGDRRERRLLYLKWQQEDLIKECIQDGYASDYENIRLTGNEYHR